jgi:type IV pilus biogenesis protein CpaD/CtpE
VLRSATYVTRRVIIAAVAALAMGCAQDPVLVVDRTTPAADRSNNLTGKASQPTRLISHPDTGDNAEARRLLLHWQIRKEGK